MTASLFARPPVPGAGDGEVGATDVDLAPDERRREPAPTPAAGGEVVDAVLDGVALTLGVLVAVAVAFDLPGPGRWPLAIAFFGWAPGWALVRLASVRASSISLLVSIGLSVSLTILVGQALVAWRWDAWRVVTVVVALAVAVVLALDLRRTMR